MQAELKTEELEEEMQEFLALQAHEDLEKRLIAELLEKVQLQQLEKAVLEEETQKQAQEDEEAEEQFLEYGIEVETVYSKEGAYQVKQPYEQDHGNRKGYENKQ